MKKSNWGFPSILHAVMVMPLVAIALHAQSPAPVPASVKDGVYTRAQAERGQKIFDASCASCHALEPKGKVTSDAPGPELAGDDFLTHMSGKPAWALAKVIKDTMPNDFSIEVTEPMALDLAAYILLVNKFPDGKAELTTDTAKTVIIVK